MGPQTVSDPHLLRRPNERPARHKALLHDLGAGSQAPDGRRAGQAKYLPTWRPSASTLHRRG
eukprot:6149173-Pyramimonas_sp.AAC.1